MAGVFEHGDGVFEIGIGDQEIIRIEGRDGKNADGGFRQRDGNGGENARQRKGEHAFDAQQAAIALGAHVGGKHGLFANDGKFGTGFREREKGRVRVVPGKIFVWSEPGDGVEAGEKREQELVRDGHGARAGS